MRKDNKHDDSVLSDPIMYSLMNTAFRESKNTISVQCRHNQQTQAKMIINEYKKLYLSCL